MSDVKRYSPSECAAPHTWPIECGVYVRDDDYAALEAECERLREELAVAKTDELNAAVWAETDKLRHDMWDAQRERDALAAELVALKAVEPVAYQCREIGEGGWADCGKGWHDYCSRSPLHDTRMLYASPPSSAQRVVPNMNDLSNVIRSISSWREMGAGVLAEAIYEELAAQQSGVSDGQ